MKAVFIAEKPSVALAIASALSSSHNTSKGVTPIHSFNLSFEGKNLNCSSTAVTGHLFSRDFPPQFQNRNTTSPVELFSAPTILVPTNARLFSHLCHVVRDVNILYLALDFDNEGENIAFEVLSVVEKSLPKNCSIKRLKFSALSRQDLLKSLSNAVEPDIFLSKSVDARQEIDLKVGVSFSRFQTDFLKGRFQLDSTMISFGPCQTPCLGFVVDQEDKIKKFVPEKYSIVTLKLFENFEFNCLRGTIFDEQIANVVRNLIILKSELKGKIVEIKRKRDYSVRPLPFNTVELLKKASTLLHFSPDKTMKIAEELYLSGSISYPRTETTAFPKSMDFKNLLFNFQNHGSLSEFVQELIINNKFTPRKGDDKGDHVPIHPINLPRSTSSDQSRLFDLVLTNFLSSISSDAEYSVLEITVKVGDELFKASTRHLIDPGFLSIQRRNFATESESSSIISDFSYKVNDLFSFSESDLTLSHHTTNPPTYLTESRLLELMEKHSIGTDASMATHIANIVSRGYVEIQANSRKYIPTDLGRLLYHSYLKIDPDLVLPTVRSIIEKNIRLIAERKLTFEEVVLHTLRSFQSKFEYFTQNIGKLVDLFSVKFSSVAESAKAVSRCGNCHRFLKLLTSSPPKLFCQSCESTFGAPFVVSRPKEFDVNGTGNMTCPVDNFELAFTVCNGRKLLFCPRCFTNPPFENPETHSLQCVYCCHPDCHHRQSSMSISDCPVDDCDGCLFADFSSKLFLSCSKCSYTLQCGSVAKFSPNFGSECDCGAVLIDFEFKKGLTLPQSIRSSSSDYNLTGKNTLCVFCDPLMSSLSTVSCRVNQNTRGRGKSRGRGRGSRGRGRGQRRGRNNDRDVLSREQQGYLFTDSTMTVSFF
ncbi:hypothetical protein RCL1_006519 [Eukaryota sp. TZLM3-RCL]